MQHVQARLVGPITAYGGQTYVTSQTGTGSTFVMQAGPTFSGSVSLATGTWHTSNSDSKQRLFFSSNGITYLKGGAASGTTIAFRDVNDVEALTITTGGGVVFGAGTFNMFTVSTDTWNLSSDTKQRLYFATNAQTYVKGATTSGTAVVLRDGNDADCVTVAAGGNVTILGAMTDSKGELRLIPQNSKSAAYTTVLADAGKHILHPSADTTARTFTIDSNANVAYPVGTAITFVNQNGAGVLTIALTSDTMRLAGSGTTGSRTLAANGIATALKVTSTEWIISGTGLT